MEITTKQKTNFWNKVDKTNSCWNWKAGKTLKGYGLFKMLGKTYLAHRVSLMIDGKLSTEKQTTSGPIGICVLHKCDNPACVNPSHLRLGSHLENMKDAKSKGRKWAGEFTGEKNNRAIITNDLAKEIKRLLKLEISQKEISNQLNVPHYIISNIAVGRSWTHI